MGVVATERRERRIEYGISNVDSKGRRLKQQSPRDTGAQRKSQRNSNEIRRAAANVRREGGGESGITTGSRGHQGDVQDSDRSASKETELTFREMWNYFIFAQLTVLYKISSCVTLRLSTFISCNLFVYV